jgi:hypothetical protein
MTDAKPRRAKKRLASRLAVGTFETTTSHPDRSAVDSTAARSDLATPWRRASGPTHSCSMASSAWGLRPNGVLAGDGVADGLAVHPGDEGVDAGSTQRRAEPTVGEGPTSGLLARTAVDPGSQPQPHDVPQVVAVHGHHIHRASGHIASSDIAAGASARTGKEVTPAGHRP